MRKIWAKDSPQSELRISRYKENGEGVESENSRPSQAMGAKDQRGNPSPIQGEGQGRRIRRGGSLPLASGGAGALPGAIIITAIFTNTAAIFTNISINSSSFYAAV